MNNKPLKIVFDANPLANNKSGVGYYVDGLVRSLSKVGGDEIVLIGHYFNFLGQKNITSLPNGKNIKYVQTKIVPGKVLSLCRKLGFQPFFELLTKTRGDILLFTNFVVLPSLFHSRKVVFIYDTGFIDCPEFVAVKNLNFLKKWVPKTIQNAKLVITNANFTKKRSMDEYGIAEDVVETSPIPPAKNSEPDTKSIARFNIPGEFLLFVGTIEPRKNINVLLDAFEQLSQDLKSKYSLVLAGGKGWKDEEIIAKAHRLQTSGLNIILTGYISDKEKATLYEKARLYIQPSLYEGYGMPVLEAMSYGKAVICSDIDVFHEIAGDSVQYFKSDDALSLLRAIDKLLIDSSLRGKIEKAGEVQLASIPSWEKTANDLLDRLRRI